MSSARGSWPSYKCPSPIHSCLVADTGHHTSYPLLHSQLALQPSSLIYSPTKLCLHNFKSLKLKLQGYAVYCEVPPQVLDQLKQYLEDYKFLSGTSACRWYINENDIPAMRTFQRGYFFNSEF